MEVEVWERTVPRVAEAAYDLPPVNAFTLIDVDASRLQVTIKGELTSLVAYKDVITGSPSRLTDEPLGSSRQQSPPVLLVGLALLGQALARARLV